MTVYPPNGDDVAAFLGQSDDASLVALAAEQVPIVTELARAYTRGNGFDAAGLPYDDVSAVITCATARLVANPEQVPYQVGTVAYRGGFTGWSLAETFVLNRYRTRLA